MAREDTYPTGARIFAWAAIPVTVLRRYWLVRRERLLAFEPNVDGLIVPCDSSQNSKLRGLLGIL